MNYSTLFTPMITLATAQATAIALARLRYQGKKLWLILGIELLIQLAINGPILLVGGLESYAKWFGITMDLPAVLTLFYISKRRDFRDLFTVLITIFLGFYLSFPSMLIEYRLGGGYSCYNVSRIIIFFVLIILIHKFIRKRYLQIQDELLKGWGIFCILPFIGILVIYYEYMRYFEYGNNVEALFSACLMICILTVVFILFLYIFKQLHEKYLAQEQQRILVLQNKAMYEQFEQQKAASEKANRRWHDMRHHTTELINLLESGETEQALQYLREQLGMDNIPKEEYCLHPAVNSILCLWAQRARKAGIHTEIHTEVPSTLAIDPSELSALFANAFENSYHGCLVLPEDTPRYIKVEATYNGKRLAIGFTNPCRKNIRFEDGIPLSEKEGGGIGSRSIVYTVKRYHGMAFFKETDGVFHARFILNL